MRIGVDVGGTKLEIIAIDPQRRGGPASSCADAAGKLRRHAGGDPARSSPMRRPRWDDRPSASGCLAQSRRPPGLVKNANSTWLIGRPFGVDLSAALGREVRLANDANCLALSEAADGAAAGRSPVFAVILGTGVGGGLAVDGRIVEGANAVAGEWGHNPMPWPTPAEWPGPAVLLRQDGLYRDAAVGSGARTGLCAGGREPAECPGNLRGGVSGGFPGARGDAQPVRGPPCARSLRRRQYRGSRGHRARRRVSNIDHLYDAVPRLWTSFVFSDQVDTQLVRAKHGDSSGVRGAAWLWPEGLERTSSGG